MLKIDLLGRKGSGTFAMSGFRVIFIGDTEPAWVLGACERWDTMFCLLMGDLDVGLGF